MFIFSCLFWVVNTVKNIHLENETPISIDDKMIDQTIK